MKVIVWIKAIIQRFRHSDVSIRNLSQGIFYISIIEAVIVPIALI